MAETYRQRMKRRQVEALQRRTEKGRDAQERLRSAACLHQKLTVEQTVEDSKRDAIAEWHQTIDAFGQRWKECLPNG